MLARLIAALTRNSADEAPDDHWDDTASLAAQGAISAAVAAPILDQDPLQQGAWFGLTMGASHRAALGAAQAEWNRLHGFDQD